MPLRSLLFLLPILLLAATSALSAQEANELIRDGERAMQRHQFDSAMALFGAAIEREPMNGEAVYNRAVCLLALGRMQEAESALGDAIALLPDYPMSYLNRGSIRAQRGDFRPAAEDFTAAIRLDSLNSMGYYMRGQVNLQAGDLVEGVIDLHEALVLETDSTRAGKITELLRIVGFAPFSDSVASFADRKRTMSISLPRSWHLKADDDGKTVNMFVSQQKVEKEQDQFAVGATIHRIRRVSKSFPDVKSGGVLLAKYWVKGLEEVGAQYPYYKVISTAPITVGPYVGVLRLVELRGQGAPFTVKMYELVVGHDDDLVTVTLEAPALIFDRYDPIFQAAIESFTIAK